MWYTRELPALSIEHNGKAIERKISIYQLFISNYYSTWYCLFMEGASLAPDRYIESIISISNISSQLIPPSFVSYVVEIFLKSQLINHIMNVEQHFIFNFLSLPNALLAFCKSERSENNCNGTRVFKIRVNREI